jgi:regulation of enolase protein 1 (concanavalin A-like superfamily)
MARSSLADDAANVFLMVSPTKYRLTYRATDGGDTEATGAATTTNFPQSWLRLSRVGNVFTAYTSTDGKTWTQYASETVVLPSTVYLGLAATSHNTNQTTTAEFRNYAAV